MLTGCGARRPGQTVFFEGGDRCGAAGDVLIPILEFGDEALPGCKVPWEVQSLARELCVHGNCYWD